MRARVVLTIALFVVLMSTGVMSAEAVSPPRCFGKTATRWLTSPGTLFFTSGDDVFVGSSGSDKFGLGDEGGTDVVCARGGDDYIYYVAGSGSIADGGSGADEVWATNGAIANGGSGDDHVNALEGATANGGSGADSIVATDGAIADGGSGTDDVVGVNAGELLGGSGNDLLVNKGGNPLMNCGSGVDRFFANGATVVRRCEVPIT